MNLITTGADDWYCGLRKMLNFVTTGTGKQMHRGNWLDARMVFPLFPTGGLSVAAYSQS
jgi:hypothetical protein